MTLQRTAQPRDEKGAHHPPPEHAPAPSQAQVVAPSAPSGAPCAQCGGAAGVPLFLQREEQPGAALPAAGAVVVGAPGEPPEGSAGRVQAKLVVGPVSDPYEREADHVARLATSGAPTPRAVHAAPGERVQRACADCGASGVGEDDELLVQRAPLPGATASAAPPPSLGPTDAGAPLARGVRARVEPVLGVSLAPVRVHTGPHAGALAHALGARAFTHGRHIWLGEHESASDVPLLAHEATHVVQQSGGAPPSIQRKPADRQHPEDGGGVLTRMRGKMDAEIGDSKYSAEIGPKRKGGAEAPAASPEEDAAKKAEQEKAKAKIDRGKLAKKKGELEPGAKPTVDRPAGERPKVTKQATETRQEVASPPRPHAEVEAQVAAQGKGAPGEKGEKGEKGEEKGKKGEKGGKEALDAAGRSAALADQSFATAASVPLPAPEVPVLPPAPVVPLDASGAPLPADPDTEAFVAGLAMQVQLLRTQGLFLRQQAAEEMANAEIMRGNIALVRSGIAESEKGVATANDHLAFREDALGKAKGALTVAEQKAQLVADGVPQVQEHSDAAKDESGPMAAESKGVVADNEANKPDDDDAAEKSEEQGGKINKSNEDISSTDDTITRTQEKSKSLAQEAEQAKATNAATKTKVTGLEQTLQKTGDRLTKMGVENATATTQADALARTPDEMTAQARAIDDQGVALIQSSYDLEQSLQQAQTSYAEGLRTVPPSFTPEEAAAAEAKEAEAAPPEATAEATTEGAPPAAAPEEQGIVRTDKDTGRWNVDLAGGVTGALPDWLTGSEPAAEREQKRAEAQAAQAKQHQEDLDLIKEKAGGDFNKLDAGDKALLALRMTGRHLFGGLSNIKWPGWGGLAKGAGKLALGMIDPRAPLMGVVSGLGMMATGVGNLFNVDAWKKDPLGNLLKSAADIMTGLTIVLGSITALAGVITAIMVGITILSFGTLAPVTGPIIAFCASVMTTVGGWTLSVGAIALELQAMVFIKNLMEAMAARNAEELTKAADKMTEDASNAGNVVLQMGMAKLAQVGGRQMQTAIAEQGGGVAFARSMGREALPSLGKGAVKGAKSLPGAIKTVAKGAKRLVTPGEAGGAWRELGTSVSGAAKSGWKGLGESARKGARELTAETPTAMTGKSAFSREFLVEGPKTSGANAEIAAAGQRLNAVVEGTAASTTGKVAGKAAAAEHPTVPAAEKPAAPAPTKGPAVSEKPSVAAEKPPVAAEKAPAAPEKPAVAEKPPAAAEGKVDVETRKLLDRTRGKEGHELTPDEIHGEMKVVERTKGKPSSEEGYVEEFDLGNGHKWKRTKDGRWCRYSDGGTCFIDVNSVKPVETTLPEAKPTEVPPVEKPPVEAPPLEKPPVKAAAEPIPKEKLPAEEPLPAAKAKPVEEARPVEEVKPLEEGKPVEEPKAVEEGKPAEAKPAEPVKTREELETRQQQITQETRARDAEIRKLEGDLKQAKQTVNERANRVAELRNRAGKEAEFKKAVKELRKAEGARDAIDQEIGTLKAKNQPLYDEYRRNDEALHPEKYPKTTGEKGDIGEAEADKFMDGRKYRKIGSSKKPTTGTGGKPQGIDGVYENASPPPRYVVGEAKYDKSTFLKGQDTAEWVDARLDQACGKKLADQIRAEGYEYWELRYDPKTKMVTPRKILVAPGQKPLSPVVGAK